MPETPVTIPRMAVIRANGPFSMSRERRKMPRAVRIPAGETALAAAARPSAV